MTQNKRQSVKKTTKKNKPQLVKYMNVISYVIKPKTWHSTFQVFWYNSIKSLTIKKRCILVTQHHGDISLLDIFFPQINKTKLLFFFF